MEKRKRVQLRILIGVIVVLCAAIAGLFLLISRHAASDSTQIGKPPVMATAGAQVKPSANSDLHDFSVAVVDYRTFAFDDLDFNFIVATVQVKGTGSVQMPLSHFKTSEGTTLDRVSSYVDRLEAKNYYLGRQNVYYSIISDTLPYNVNIFIPVLDKKADSLTVTADFDTAHPLNFKLSPATGTKAMLTYTDGDVISDGKTYQMTVSKALNITGDPLYELIDGQENEYLLPSTTEVYAFQVNAVSLWGDAVTIEDAEYVPEGTKDTFKALGSSIYSMKYANIIGRTILDQDQAYVLFYAYDPAAHPITYHGHLRLKVKGQENWIHIDVNLN